VNCLIAPDGDVIETKCSKPRLRQNARNRGQKVESKANVTRLRRRS